MRSGDWKLGHFFDDDHVELYNLKADLGETTDLATTNPTLAKELRHRLASWRRSVGAQIPTVNPNFDPARRLESIRWTPTAPQNRKY